MSTLAVAPATAPPPGRGRPWEVTLLRRAEPRRRPRVAGRLRFEAEDAATARAIAEDGLARRAAGDEGWALGPLRPLARAIPGTHPYRVTFAVWRESERGFTRDDVLVLTLWATDGGSARRLALGEAQANPAHEGAWRVREVRRVGSPGSGR